VIDKHHPGFSDAEYRSRRDNIAQIAKDYQVPALVPDVSYIDKEHKVWSDVLTRIAPLHKKYACSGYLDAFKVANLSIDKIPQLSEINEKLSSHTGFCLSPVPGLVPSRSFLSELSFGRMLSTQYIRHHSVPDYTPEPDIIHELLGHAVPFFTQEYCELNKLFGKAAQTVSNKDLVSLERLYWYTIEFGLVMEDGCLKAFGAGLISSIGELLQINTVPLRDFCVQDIIDTDYNTSHMQPSLYCASSYSFMKEEITRWIRSVLRG
jgi:phenylalanine-4-hydroxylase